MSGQDFIDTEEDPGIEIMFKLMINIRKFS